MVRQTETTLQTVVDRVAEIDRLVAGIAQSSGEQASSLTEVEAAVAQMDQITQQNAAMGEEASAATQSLNQEAARLVDLVGTFRLSGHPGRAIPSPKAETRRPARRGAAVQGNLAVARSEWEEF